MVLATGFAAIRRVGASVLTSFRSFGEGCIDEGPVPVDLVGSVKFGQQNSMQIAPNTGFVPQLQVMTTRFAASAAQITGKVVPSEYLS